MKYGYLIILLMLLLCIVPAHADSILNYNKYNSTSFTSSGSISETDWFAQQGYVPWWFVVIAMCFGAYFTGLSVASQRKVVPVTIAPLFWGYAAWYAVYMYNIEWEASSNTFYIMQIIMADGILRYLLIAITVLTTIYAIYVWFIEPNTDKKTSGPFKAPE
jgi:hypothetical protein